jgi:hypothetical protein
MSMMKVHSYRYRNLRYTALLVLLVIGAMFALAYGSRQGEKFTCDLEPHTVTYGDTLWSIAEDKCDGNIQVVTDNLADVYGTTIHSGQNIYLPENQDCLLTLTDDGEVFESCDK